MLIGGIIVKKRLLSAVLVAVLFSSLPFPALANNTSSTANESITSKGSVATVTSQQALVTVEVFIDKAVTALTFQHGSKPMRDEIINSWVRKGELKNRKAFIKREEMARILIRGLGVEKQEKSLADYMKSANKLGLFKGVSVKNQTITVKEMETIFDNCQKVKSKGINNKGVNEISVEDFMKNPGSFGYQLSPEGNYVSVTLLHGRTVPIFLFKK